MRLSKGHGRRLTCDAPFLSVIPRRTCEVVVVRGVRRDAHAESAQHALKVVLCDVALHHVAHTKVQRARRGL